MLAFPCTCGHFRFVDDDNNILLMVVFVFVVLTVNTVVRSGRRLNPIIYGVIEAEAMESVAGMTVQRRAAASTRGVVVHHSQWWKA